MKTITNDYKTNIKEFGRELDSIITYTAGSEIIELGTEDLNSVTPSFQTDLLKSVMKQLDIDSNVEIPEGTELNYQFGIKIGNSYEYIDFGNYIVYKVEKQEDTLSYKITCYDKMLYSMVDYENMEITYPITIRSYIETICTHLGLTFANSTDTFANYNRQIQKELYLDSNGNSLGYTFRDVLDELAQVTASNICINSDNELEIRYINDTNDTINEEYLKDINVNFGEKFGPVNSIVLSRAGGSDNVYLRDEQSVTQNGLCELKISDNQIMNFNDRSDYLPDILAQLDGLEYYINDFASTGITYYDVCDKYNVEIDGNTYSCIMLNDEILVTQGLEENVYVDRPEDSETDYTKADKTDRKINQTYIMVDKVEGEIEALASSVQDLTDFLKTVEGTSEITLENTTDSNGAIGRLEITGFSEKNLYPGMAYPSNKVYPNKMTTYVIIQENEDGTKHNETYIDLGVPLISTDKLIIDNNKVSVQRINGSITTDLEVILKTFEGETNISVKYFDNANIKCQYIEKNDFTKYFATQTELQSQILITDEGINSRVSKAEVISEINQSAEEIQINANKISLAGKTIDMTGEDVIITSANFKVDKDGNVTASNANITGGELNLTGNDISPKFQITSATDATRYMEMYPSDIRMWKSDALTFRLTTLLNTPILGLSSANSDYSTSISSTYINLTDGTNTTVITSTSVVPGSLEKSKKNISLFTDGLNVIKETNIYEYNYKSEKDTRKKHIGFVIGDKYKYSHKITGTDEKGNEIGAELYSMISVCMQAIKEQQEMIEELQKEIKILKNGK